MKKITAILLAMLTLSAAYGRMPEKAVASSQQENSQVIHLTEAEFLQKVYNYQQHPDAWQYEGDKPAIVDFYATWCGPCKRIAPILEELAETYAGQIVIYKIDTDKEPALAAAFGIRSIPTLLFIPMNGQPQVAQGALPKEELTRAIEEVLLAK